MEAVRRTSRQPRPREGRTRLKPHRSRTAGSGARRHLTEKHATFQRPPRCRELVRCGLYILSHNAARWPSATRAVLLYATERAPRSPGVERRVRRSPRRRSAWAPGTVRATVLTETCPRRSRCGRDPTRTLRGSLERPSTRPLGTYRQDRAIKKLRDRLFCFPDFARPWRSRSQAPSADDGAVH